MAKELSFKDGRKLLEVTDILMTYIVAIVSQMYTYLQTHEIVCVS